MYVEFGSSIYYHLSRNWLFIVISNSHKIQPINRNQTNPIQRQECHILFKNFGCQIYSGYINQSLEVDEYFPLLTNTDEYEYRSDVFDDQELEDELQFDIDDHGTYDPSEDEDDDDEDDDDDSYYDSHEDNDDDSKPTTTKLIEMFRLDQTSTLQDLNKPKYLHIWAQGENIIVI